MGNSPPLGLPEPNMVTFAVTSLVAAVLPNLFVYAEKPSVPPIRLMGKHASYIEVYSETYQSTVKKQRLKWIAMGSLTRTLMLTGSALTIILNNE